MKLWNKSLSALICASLLAAACSGTALAATAKEKITSLKLNVESDIEVGDDTGDVTVTTEDAHYEVADVSVVNDEGQWTSGDVPRIEVTLEAANDYYFDSMSKSKVKLSGDDATYVTSHREDNKSVLIVTVKLDALEGSLEIESVEWEGNDTPVARWETTDGAKSYQE